MNFLLPLFQYLLAFAISYYTLAYQIYFTSDPLLQRSLWQKFKVEYNKTYETKSVDDYRFSIFLSNLQLADERNSLEKSGIHGITIFSDLTTLEFEHKYLGFVPDLNVPLHAMFSKSGVNSMTTDIPLDVSVDWTGVYTTPIKNQGYCGSCWAFAAIEQIESDIRRTTGMSYLLSAQQVVDCDPFNSGCNGGWAHNAFKYVNQSGGLVVESDYRYTSGSVSPYTEGSCQYSATSRPVATISGFRYLNTEAEMASYVSSTGPIVLTIAGNSLLTYKTGILTNASCDINTNHQLQAVGVTVSSTGQSYWKIRNQWGIRWGENGYARISYGQGTCGINRYPAIYTMPTLITTQPTSGPTSSPSFTPTISPTTNTPTISPSTTPSSTFPSKSPAYVLPFLTYCPYFTATGTSSATINTIDCKITICTLGLVTISTCPSSGGTCASGNDIYLNLYDTKGILVASNDNYCGLCSEINYQPPAGTCQVFTLQQGCAGSSSCGGQVAIANGIAKLELSGTPTTKPTISLSPSFRPSSSKPSTRNPTSVPSRAPTKIPSLRPSPSPSTVPTKRPTGPSTVPTKRPITNTPTRRPSSTVPTRRPNTFTPTSGPTKKPSWSPTRFPTTTPSR